MLRLHSYTYHRPDSVSEALELLAGEPGEAMPIAGGTDLVPNMKHRLFTPARLVALRGIDEMRGIDEVDGGLRIGAAESLDRVAADERVRRIFPALAAACGLISGPQLRRMGTIGGNVCLDTRCTYYNQTWFWRKALGFCLKKDGDLCHVVKGGTRCVAAHSADTPPVLIVHDSSLEIVGPSGSRSVPVADFFTSDGIWNRRMEPDELLVSIHLPAPEDGVRASYQKLRSRDAIDFPLASLAVAAMIDADGTVRDIRMVATAMGSYPRRLGSVDEAAVGNRLTPSVIDAIAEQAFRQCHPLDNLTADKEWRRAMVPVLVRKALGEIAG